MEYGYCRCSTNEDRQDIDRQIRDLKQMGIEEKNIYMEYESGHKTKRIQFDRLLNVIRVGDTIATTEVPRLSRSTKQLCEILELAYSKKLKLVIGKTVFDCTGQLDPMAEGMFLTQAVFAQLESRMISYRVKSGMRNAAAKGVKIGRPAVDSISKLPDKFLTYYPRYKENAIKTKTDLANLCRCTRPTLDKYIRIYEKGFKE